MNKFWNKRGIATIIGIAFLFFAFVLGGCEDNSNPNSGPDTTPGDADELEGKLVILQAYGTGAAENGPVSHSFVELYNTTNSEINLSGYSLQYADGTKTVDNATADGAWNVIELTGSVPAGSSFLILGAKKNENARLSIDDSYGDMSAEMVLSNRAFKVALVKSTDALTVQNPFDIDGKGNVIEGYVDMLGALNDDTDRILGYETEAAMVITRNIAARRIVLPDTNMNSLDFEGVDYRVEGTSNSIMEAKRPKNVDYGK